MEFHLYIIGTLLMVLALIHIIFPKYFNWKIELQPLSLINRQMMTTHTFFIALTVFLMGLLCVTSATQLIKTSLGNKIILGLAIFWSIRLFFQFFVYSKILWKGKKFETVIHIIFSGFWVYLCTIFFTIYFNN
ncbi:hypothetical protein [Cellulophaga fucicola]|uniref:Cytochrome C and Quinol oxidase polypeptide I n=1 Tax=Cellulophaga fucicola TaxID=76595 RepID=A0A1K1P3I1_9FLAO|nr:hypothetical protein [Cellulophaga fucicola]SFW42140.1 hypothetical protein SAMN05660313_01588 [Cellulophaga fucicola]